MVHRNAYGVIQGQDVPTNGARGKNKARPRALYSRRSAAVAVATRSTTSTSSRAPVRESDGTQTNERSWRGGGARAVLAGVVGAL